MYSIQPLILAFAAVPAVRAQYLTVAADLVLENVTEPVRFKRWVIMSGCEVGKGEGGGGVERSIRGEGYVSRRSG